MRALLILVLTFLLPVTAIAASASALSTGDKAPVSLALQDQNGTQQTLETLSGQKGITLVFVRSADWCPYCQSQILDLNDSAGEFEQKGYPLVVLSYDSVEKLGKFNKKHQVDITLLSDPMSSVIRDFGILNMEHAKGSFAYGVPHPAVYVIGKDGTIQAKYTEEGYKKRPAKQSILGGIEGLSAL